MTSAKLVDVTLVMTWSPAEPQGHVEHRIIFAMALDPQGGPDAQAWLDDPAAWAAWREGPGAEPIPGDVTHDEDGWSLRFFPDPALADEAPPHRILGGVGWLRPGEVVTLRAPDGAEAAWRVVGVG